MGLDSVTGIAQHYLPILRAQLLVEILGHCFHEHVAVRRLNVSLVALSGFSCISAEVNAPLQEGLSRARMDFKTAVHAVAVQQEQKRAAVDFFRSPVLVQDVGLHNVLVALRKA